MYAITLAILLIGGDLNQSGKYFVRYTTDGALCWIADDRGSAVMWLNGYAIYENGTRLKLISKQGFTLENIPLDNERWYNECIEIFQECETQLPRAYQCMKKNGQVVREINTLRFTFPEKPVLDATGQTHFYCENAYTCRPDGTMVRGAMWVVGLYERSKDLIIVTLRPGHRDYITVHEYIHACGYPHICDVDQEQEKKNFACAKRIK